MAILTVEQSEKVLDAMTFDLSMRAAMTDDNDEYLNLYRPVFHSHFTDKTKTSISNVLNSLSDFVRSCDSPTQAYYLMALLKDEINDAIKLGKETEKE